MRSGAAGPGWEIIILEGREHSGVTSHPLCGENTGSFGSESMHVVIGAHNHDRRATFHPPQGRLSIGCAQERHTWKSRAEIRHNARMQQPIGCAIFGGAVWFLELYV